MKVLNIITAIATLLLFVNCSKDDEIPTLTGDDGDIVNDDSSTITPPNSGVSGVETSLDEFLAFDIAIDLADLSGDDIEEVIPTDETDENFDDFVENSSFSERVTIVYSASTATITNTTDGVEITTDGANVVVTSTVKGVEYVVSGNTANGSLKIYSEKKFLLTLSGVELTNPCGSAINVQSGKRAFVVLADGSQNSLTDGEAYTLTDGEDMKGCLFSEGELIFSGSGTLNVTGKYKHAICSDDYVRIRKGCKINILNAAKDGIHTNDGVIVGGGVVSICATDDGIQSEEGAIRFDGGRTTIVITTEAKYEDDDISSSSCINGVGEFVMNGGTLSVKATGAAGKGINNDGDITINGGSIRVITTGKQYVYGSLDSSAKGIKSKANITINDGTIWLKTTGGEGSEALESKNELTINGGSTTIFAYDDAINASNSIVINGGNNYCYSSGNDGIDSNGTITVTGGTTISIGTTAPEEGFDCDQNTFKITGGTLLGLGGATSTPTLSACTQKSVVYGGSGTSGQNISIVAADGAQLFSYVVPRSYSQMTLLYSSALLGSGSYTIYSGGTVVGGNEFCGFTTNGTYTAGTSLSTFTASATVTTIGSTGGQGGNVRPGGR